VQALRNRVVSVGDIIVDIIIFSHTFPSIGSDTEVSDLLIDQGGSAANFASAIASLGMKTSIIGKVGNDWFGRFLVSKLRRLGVDTSYVKFDKKINTGIAFTIVNSNNERTMLSYRGANVKLSPNEINEECIKNAKLLQLKASPFKAGMKTLNL